MLHLVKLALSRPYTFVVLAIMILISGSIAWLRTPTDIFPNIKIPVIAVVWSYNGLPPKDMAGRVITYFEQELSTTVNDIDHIESQSLGGVGVVRIFFQPNVDIRTATAQVTSISQTVLKNMPPGITPPMILNYNASTVPIVQLALSSKELSEPMILNYNASTVPIVQLALSSKELSEQKIFDLGQTAIRPSLAAIPGASIPTPYGGRQRQIQIDLNPAELEARHLSASDVSAALAAQNQIVPAGTARIGRHEFNIQLNNSPSDFSALNDLPIKTGEGGTVTIGDVAHVRDGSPPQANIVRVNGGRAVLMMVLKSGFTSTVEIVDNVKALIPQVKLALPSSLKIDLLSDQSIFVRAAVSGVIHEGVLAAALTSLMILLFLGSWRSTVIIAASIPLAVLSAVAGLAISGETLNVMTMGGLALAVGILVDDATVTIENINWHLEHGKSVRQSILDGAEQIVRPALVSLLCICIAFVPMFFLPGIAGFLFAPMAKAVVFAMIASFVISRTLVPTMGNYLLREHGAPHTAAQMVSHDAQVGHSGTRNPFRRFQHGFEQRFERIRTAYLDLLRLALAGRGRFLIGFMALVLVSFALVPFLGRNFFPAVDAGQINMHVRAPSGTRIEETAALFDKIEDRIRSVIPKDQLGSIVDNIGLPVSNVNRAYMNSGSVGPQDGDILVSLSKEHGPTEAFVKKLRTALPAEFTGTTFSFLPADMVSQILNFGAPAPIDVMITGKDAAANKAYADLLVSRLKRVAGLADVRLQQADDYPQLDINVDRTRASTIGLTENDVTRSLSINLAGSLQTAPVFWLNPENGVSYPIVAQVPPHRIASMDQMENLPVTGVGSDRFQILGALGSLSREASPAVVSHYSAKRSYDVYATLQGRDLGSVATEINRILKETEKDKPATATVVLRGQVQTMNTAFLGLILGLAGAVILIYMLLVVNFQSWIDPAIIISALPAALAGIAWMLFGTETPLSVPALTGAIMCMGVATANSVLVVSFARERLAETGDALLAAIEAGSTRFRPVLMTALAMIIGMGPMALGLGEGGEQNAPLGRAVIGGLVCATIATLVFVPSLFSLAHRKRGQAPAPESAEETSGDIVYAE